MMQSITQKTINAFHTYKKGVGEHVVIEGLHALKHAKRFDAEITEIFTHNKSEALTFLKTYASEKEIQFFAESAQEISFDDFSQLTHNLVRTGVIALAKKGKSTLDAVESDNTKPIVVLEDARDLANIGAVARVCAARGVGALIVTGSASPWHVQSIRGGAGLQWAMPTIQTTVKEVYSSLSNYEFIACSDEGEDMYNVETSQKVVYVFGTERQGVTKDTKDNAQKIISIPMQKGVSSMNLATSVSAILFCMR